MPEIPQSALDLLTQALEAITGEADDDEEQDDEPQTLREMLMSVAREVMGGDADDDDEDGDEDWPLEVAHAALRHVVQTRFPQLDIDAELARVSGLSLTDSGDVEGEAQYEPSNAIRQRVRGQTGPRPGNRGTSRRKSGGKSGGQQKAIGDMTPAEIAAFARENGDETGAAMFEAMAGAKNNK